jgi:hypothetical protein
MKGALTKEIKINGETLTVQKAAQGLFDSFANPKGKNAAAERQTGMMALAMSLVLFR